MYPRGIHRETLTAQIPSHRPYQVLANSQTNSLKSPLVASSRSSSSARPYLSLYALFTFTSKPRSQCSRTRREIRSS